MLALFALALTLSACNPLGDEEAEASADDLVAQIPLPDGEGEQVEETFVGLTENGIGVGIVVHDGAAVAYICDGRELGHWLKGNVDDDQIDLQHDAGTRLDAQVGDDVVTGTVTLSDGERLAFSATPAVNQGSGLFRSTELQDGFVYGWIVLVDDEGLVSVRGLGTDSKTKAVDGDVSVDIMDPGMDFGIPEKGSAPPVVEQSADDGGPSVVITPGQFTCDQLEDSYEAIMFAGDHVTSKQLQHAYYAMALEYMSVAGGQGCTWPQGD
jgi:hypothetical protein